MDLKPKLCKDLLKVKVIVINMIGEKLLRFQDNQKYCFFDMETCNLNLSKENYVWQVGWLIANKSEIFETHNYFLNWGDKLKVSKQAALITRFDPDIVKREGKDPKEIYIKFRNVLDNKTMKYVGHHGLSFDSMIEKIWCEAIGEKHDWEYLDRFYDSSLIAKAIKKNIKPDLNNFLAWQFKMTTVIERGLRTNLAFLAKENGIDSHEVDFHDALYDIKVMRQLFFRQIWQIEI